jgi:hypothetical protein
MLVRNGAAIFALAAAASSTPFAFAAAAETDDTSLKLMEWFASRGGVLDGVAVHQFPGMGRGVLAVRALEAKDPVISVPFELCITRETALASAADDPLLRAVYESAKSEEDLIAMVLLRERALGAASDWKPYLDSLPRSIPQASGFADAVLKAAQDPYLARSARERGEKIAKRFQELKPTLEQLAATVGPTISKVAPGEDAAVASASAYRWALAVVSSRALTFRGKRYLAPITDMFNYSPHPSPREAASGAFYLDHHVLEHADEGTRGEEGSKGMLRVYADRATLEHAQLFEDYGDNTNSLYIDHHGFVPDVNPFDCINIPFHQPPGGEGSSRDAAKAKAARLQVLQRLGVPANSVQCLRNVTKGADGKLPWSAYVWLTVMDMPQATLTLCQKQIQARGSNEGLDGNCPVIPLNLNMPPYVAFPPENWELGAHAAKQWVLPAVQRRIASFPTSHAEDSEAVQAAEAVASTAFDALGSAKENLDEATRDKKPRGWGFGKKQKNEEEARRDFAAAESAAAQAYEAVLVIKYRMKQKELATALEGELLSLMPTGTREKSSPSVEVEVAVADVSDPSMSSVVHPTPPRATASNTWTDHADCIGEEKAEDGQSLACAVAVFNAWLSSQQLPVAKLEAQVVPGMRIGAVATEPIKPEELYLSVPLRVIMDSNSARRSTPLLESGVFSKAARSREADFFVLLFHLLYEYQVLGSKSFYWPYLRLLPQLHEIKPPCEYGDEEMKLLEGSEVHRAIRSYKHEVERHWKMMQSKADADFGAEAAALFGAWEKDGLPEDVFRWAHYVLNSRSIWWNGARHLVPLLDLINCKEGPDNPERVHATRLDSTGQNADTLAPWGFAKGDQVFENYGQPNHIYFQYHGFVLDENTHDCVSLRVEITKDDAESTEGGINAMRRTMVQNRFNSAQQSFCVANPLLVQKAAAAKQASTGDGPIHSPISIAVEPRLRAFLAIKNGKSPGSDVTAELCELVEKKLEAYPSGDSASASTVVAGEGIGGGSGSSHPAVKLVTQEKELLRNLLAVLV